MKMKSEALIKADRTIHRVCGAGRVGRRSLLEPWICDTRPDFILVSQFGGRPSQIDRNIDSYGRRQSRRVFPKVRFSRFIYISCWPSTEIYEISRIYQVEIVSIANAIAILQLSMVQRQRKLLVNGHEVSLLRDNKTVDRWPFWPFFVMK